MIQKQNAKPLSFLSSNPRTSVGLSIIAEQSDEYNITSKKASTKRVSFVVPEVGFPISDYSVNSFKSCEEPIN